MTGEVRRGLSESPDTEMKCLFCDNPVPLVQSLVQRGVPFCCDGHRQAYHADTQRLMLARLMETRKRYGHVRTERLKPAEPTYEPANQMEFATGVRPKMRFQPLITG